MTTFGTLQSLVTISIGGRTDADAVSVIKAAINYAIAVISVIYKPPELKSILTYSYPVSSDYISINTNDWAEITRVYNLSDSKELKFIPFDKLTHIVPSSLTATKFYSLFGDLLYLRAIPTATKTLEIAASVLPTALVESSDLIPFSGYDSYIVSFAAGFTFMAFEESESAKNWMEVIKVLDPTFMFSSKSRDILQKTQAYFDLAAQGGS